MSMFFHYLPHTCLVLANAPPPLTYLFLKRQGYSSIFLGPDVGGKTCRADYKCALILTLLVEFSEI